MWLKPKNVLAPESSGKGPQEKQKQKQKQTRTQARKLMEQRPGAAGGTGPFT